MNLAARVSMSMRPTTNSPLVRLEPSDLRTVTGGGDLPAAAGKFLDELWEEAVQAGELFWDVNKAIGGTVLDMGSAILDGVKEIEGACGDWYAKP